jgi:D-xylose transport system permease protein
LRRQVLIVFALMGLLSAIAGILYTARVGSASPDAGLLLELDAIAACVIGGASLMGGRGTVLGACLGALLMASLDNSMSLRNVPDFIQDIVKGGILVAAVGIDVVSRRRSS